MAGSLGQGLPSPGAKNRPLKARWAPTHPGKGPSSLGASSGVRDSAGSSKGAFLPSPSVDAVLKKLGFAACHAVEGRTSIADVFPRSKRCGIYVLECSTGEVYAGQAVDVTRRYVQHLKTHKDVTRLHFQRAAKRDLDLVEKTVIKTLQEKGLKTRNITYSSTVIGETDLDLIMPPEAQRQFEEDVSFKDASGQRTRDDDLRRRLDPRFALLRERPQAQDYLRLVRAYLPLCVPAPIRTELSFWCLSVPPRPPFVYSRLNVGWQEVLTAYQRDDGILWASFHVAASPLGLFGTPKSAWKKYALAKQVEISDHAYEPGGPDQLNLELPVDEALELLKDADFLRAARLLNLRLMRKSATPYGKFHCFALADQVLPGAH